MRRHTRTRDRHACNSGMNRFLVLLDLDWPPVPDRRRHVMKRVPSRATTLKDWPGPRSTNLVSRIGLLARTLLSLLSSFPHDHHELDPFLPSSA